MDQDPEPVEQFFGKHANDYSKSRSHAQGADLAALIEALAPRSSDVALDVATGTGFTAVALSKRVAKTTGIDVTDQMLNQARRFAETQGAENLTFERGDALQLKYADGSFDIVVTRRAAHHFRDVPRFLSEAGRVLKSGGRLGVADMSPPEGAQEFMNRTERLRDRGHVEAFSPGAWGSMVSRAGFRILSSRTLDERVSFEKWLYPVAPGGEEERSIRREWLSAPRSVRELLGATFRGEEVRSLVKSRIVLVASKTP